MQSWIKFCKTEDLIEGKDYFFGWHCNQGDLYHERCVFIGRGINGKAQWTEKPGIAVRFSGGNELRERLSKNPEYKAVEIPADADRRWKARKRKF